MTNARMIRVLERGGCAIQRPDGNWDIKRTHDARGTTIGRLEAQSVATLCHDGLLKRLGDYDPIRLIWSSGQNYQTVVQCFPDKALAHATPSASGGSLVERCLQALPCDKVRERLSGAVEAYREDTLWISRQGAVSGMNWRGLALGTRISGANSLERPLSNRNAYQAGRRLQRIAERFGLDWLKELNSLVLDEVSRNRFSETFDVPRRKVEARAKAHLELLAEIYECDLARPSRIRG